MVKHFVDKQIFPLSTTHIELRPVGAFFSKLVRTRSNSTRITSLYSHLFNKHGGWNKRGGVAKVAKSLNVEGGIFWKILVHKSNKPGVEGGKI